MTRWSLFLLTALAATGATIPGQYIVELESAPAAGMRNGAARTHRARLRTEHDTMRTRLGARRAQVFGETDTVINSVFVQLDGDGALQQVRATPGVKRVYPVREFRHVMDRILLTHKAVDVWAQVGESRAGEGIKVGIIDSGIDVGHPALKGEGFTAPDGSPRATNDSDLAYTNGNVIVARSYVSLLSRRDPDNSARDRVGHGTALAAIIAGARTAGPLATVTGMAPRARIGVYKVFGSPNVNDATSEAALLRAIDDAVADGMDVINLSLGSDLATRLDDDPMVAAVERASRAGVLVIAAAGNNGPGLNTLNSPGTAPSAITVGAVTNSRTFATGVDVAGLGRFASINSSGSTATAPINHGDGGGCDGARSQRARLRGVPRRVTQWPRGAGYARVLHVRREAHQCAERWGSGGDRVCNRGGAGPVHHGHGRGTVPGTDGFPCERADDEGSRGRQHRGDAALFAGRGGNRRRPPQFLFVRGAQRRCVDQA